MSSKRKDKTNLGSNAPPPPVQGSVLDRTPPPEVLKPHLELRRLTSVLLLSLLSTVLLGISFAPFDCWFVSYIALVPWALAMAGGKRGVWTIIFGWVSGWIFWAAMLYWLVPVTLGGYLGGVAYLSLYWLAASLLIRFAMRRGWPMWITLSVFWVGLEFLRARFPILEFPWFFLSQTQYARTQLIQICDVTGQYGVSFLVAMVNGVVIDLLYSALFVRVGDRVMLGRHIFRGMVITGILIVGFLTYGTLRMRQKTTSPGPLIGIVQEKFPISLQGRSPSERTFLESHLQRSLEFIGDGCDLIIWPETMLPRGMNLELQELDVRTLDEDNVRSLAVLFWGPEEQKKHSYQELQGFLRLKIGPEKKARYDAAAARYVLKFVTPDKLKKLDKNAVRIMAERLFGRENIKEMDATNLRNAVGLYVRDFEVDGVSLDLLRRISLFFPEAPILQEAAKDAKTFQKEIRKFQQKGDDSKLKTLRGQASMVEICSVLVGCPVMAGGTTFRRNRRPTGKDDLWVYQNSVLWFDERGVSEQVYSKIHLVPFSESVPFKYSWGGLHRVLRSFVPPVMPQLNAGKEFTRFELRRGSRTWYIVTPICFEGTFAELCRKMVEQGPKDNLVLANLSNDGWFVYRSGRGPYRGTTEQAQHLVHSVFRAVENRVPVVRAVNTGISAMIDSNGRIESVLELRVEEYRKRTMVAGVMRGCVLVDSRRTLYSSYGDVFALLVSAAALAMTAGLVCT
ncbi:MAG TPA: hypothetical protein ENH84_03470, partial [Phycisphaerae bacterium]|nr:hypothetical protein [Phycisphaerae bacterium]